MDGEHAAQSLKQKFDTCSSAHSEASRVRIHRAISWLARAQRETEDADARFLFLWIAFNAAYAREFGFEESQRGQSVAFIEAVCALDAERRLHASLFSQFSGPVRTLIDNRFVFEPFWRALRDHDASGRWEATFAASKQRATKAILAGETAVVLGAVFDRLYVLRNQLVHGGATWNSKVNRQQVRDGANLMGSLVPIVIGVMLEHPEAEFGEVAFPVV